MATNLCGSAGLLNTGQIACDIERATPAMMLIGGSEFTSGDYADSATMDAAIITKLKLPQGNSQKLYPFPVIQGVTDKTEAAKYGSLGFGLQFKLVRSKPGYEFDVLAGSSLEKKLISFDGKTVPVLIYDSSSAFWGKKDASDNFVGASCQVGVEPRPFGDGQNAKATKVTISFVDPADFVESAFAYVSSLTTASLTGLKDVTMSKLSNSTNVYKVKFKIPTAKLGTDLDIWDDFGTAIAARTFTALAGPDYVDAFVVTSVAADNTLKALTVTFDSTAYTALGTGDTIKLVPPTPAVLDAADITGVEFGTLIVTK